MRFFSPKAPVRWIVVDEKIRGLSGLVQSVPTSEYEVIKELTVQAMLLHLLSL